MIFRASLVAQMVKCLPAMQETLVRIPGLGRSPGGGHGNALQYSCLENPHGQRILAGYSPWGLKESDTIEVTEHACTQLVPTLSSQSFLINSLFKISQQ